MATSSINALSVTTAQDISVGSAALGTAAVDMLTGTSNGITALRSVYLANLTTAAVSATVTATIGGVEIPIVSAISVPANNTLTPVTSIAPIYLNGAAEKVSAKAGASASIACLVSATIGGP